jgi:hypothetical protein
MASVLVCQLGDVLVCAGGLLVRLGSPVVSRSRLSLRSAGRARCARCVLGYLVYPVLGIRLWVAVSDKCGGPSALSCGLGMKLGCLGCGQLGFRR